jgi:dipeptidyl aminopeptidase/acylaminoacyl peptidase
MKQQNRLCFALSAIAVTLCAAASLWSQSTSRAASIIDSMPKVKEIDQATISPDGAQVAFIIGGELSVMPSKGGTVRSIAVDGKLALRDVSWSRDSRQITFIADLEGDTPAAQIFIATLDGSSPVKHADVKGYAAAPTFSPDGSKLALLFIEGMPRIAGPLQPMTPLAGVIDDKVYEQRLTTIDLSTNTLTQVTPADVYVYEYDWTPDSQGWVATAAHGSGDANWYVAKLCRINAQSGEMREIYTPKWQIAEPHISPDGKNVAFIEGLMSDEGSTGGDIYVIAISGGAPQNLTPNIHSSPSSLIWTGPDQITFTQNVDGESGLATLRLTPGTIQPLWSGAEHVAASFSHDGSVTSVVRQSASAAPDVWAGPVGKWKQLTTINADAKPAWGEMRNFHWTNGNLKLEGWLMLPKDFAPGKTYPLVVNVHGGPSAACSSHWDSKMMGAESAMGYFAFCPNLRGSYGQGEDFTRANIKDFGGGDFHDIMTGVDAILKQYPIDPRRIGIRGHSYGGYMTMWAETQTQRFAAAVAGAGLSDWLSYYGVNDIDEWMIPFFGASIYDDPAVYAKSDPMHFVKAVKTPTLVLVGDRDGEVPMEQSVEWWHALQAMKVPVRLVVYPNEGHVFVKPADSRDYFVRTLDWFDEWFGKVGAKP